jgi:chemotaxis protein MotB
MKGRWVERDEDLENELNRSALWAVTYGDVMSYLMIIFLVLFAFTYSKNISSQFSAAAIEARFGRKWKSVEQLFAQKGIQQIARIEVREDRIRLSFLEPVLFDPGRAALKTSSLPHLEKLAEALNEIPNALQIEGHTDSIPLMPGSEFPSNWELSAARAFSVLRFFLLHGISPARLSALGYGEFQPAAPNTTPEGRSANRRIEVNILRLQAGE